MVPKNNEDVVYEAIRQGVLMVDHQGRIWRKEGRRAEHDTGSYLQVRVMRQGTRTHCMAHRLVWRHLFGPIPAGLTINHRNGVKTDNRPENLELVTYSGNLRHAYRTGLKAQWGQFNPAAKLTDAEVTEIRRVYARGAVTQAQLANQYGVAPQTVSNIVRGERRQTQMGPTGDYTARRQRPDVRRDQQGRFTS